MSAQITSILADAGVVIGALVGGVGDVANFMITNPLLLISVSLTLVGFAVGIVRRFMHN